MLHIILLILKIIGIILLCVVGILFLATICVLCVPVRYRIRLTREEGENKPPVEVYVKVTWLLHLVNILVRYPAEVMVRVRILIFTVFKIPEKEKKAGKRSAIRKKETQKKKKETKEKSEVPEDSAITEAHKQLVNSENEIAQRETDQTESEEPKKKESLFTQIKKIIKKIKRIVEKIKEFFQNIQYTIRKLCDKMKSVLDNIQYYREVLDSDSFRQSVGLCRRELGWALKKLKPDKFEADFIVGMDNPAMTGEILAICGMLYPLIGQHVRVVGDFDCEKMHIEGQLYIRGRIRVITFMQTAVRIYFNKDIKKLIKLLKKEDV